MADFGIIHRFSGGTSEQYDKALPAVHPDGGRGLPPGQLVHAAGRSGNDWVVVALWDSEASWEKFRDGTLLPGLASVEGGLQGPPQETTFEIVNFQTA